MRSVAGPHTAEPLHAMAAVVGRPDVGYKVPAPSGGSEKVAVPDQPAQPAILIELLDELLYAYQRTRQQAVIGTDVQRAGEIVRKETGGESESNSRVARQSGAGEASKQLSWGTQVTA
jgi:hypothetical protein